MNLFKDAYFSKSGMILGKELNHCFKCAYCRANNQQLLDYTKYLPSELNSNFSNIPVLINLFYGDPTLQIEGTMNLLDRLEKVGHKGFVVIITKGDMEVFRKVWHPYNLSVHFGISTFGVNSLYDGGNLERFERNLDICKDMGVSYSIEYRPIIKNINDSNDAFNYVVNVAHKHNVGIGYCGLQVSEETRERFEKEGIRFEPYNENVGFGLKKFISKERENALRGIAKTNNVGTFKKTSCLIATAKGVHDYNAHYYRPNEVGCYDCANKEICKTYKDTIFNNPDINALKGIIPFNFELITKDNHVCTLYKNGLCQFPSYDCMHIQGKLIKIEDEITTTDVRLIKWLTGYTVDAKFIEVPFMSKAWVK
jgi:hypothetical protein